MPKVERVSSVDILRGIVMATMIFVNCSYFNAPWWSLHYKSGGDGITYVDLVFPGFLFLAGVAIPLAFERYEKNWRGRGLNLFHVIYRAATLMIMGVLYVNMSPDVEKMGLTYRWWLIIPLLLIFMVWHQYRGEKRWGHWVSNIIKLCGVAGLIWYFSYYETPWGSGLQASWWGILGLIGRSYLIASLLYMIIGRRTELLMFTVLMMTLIHIVSFGGGLNEWWYLGFGAPVSIFWGQGSVTMLGVVCGAKLLEAQKEGDREQRHRDLLRFFIFFALLSFICGEVLHKIYGIHKDSTFPAYVYTSVGYTMLVWIMVYLISDIKGINNAVTRFFLQVGSVPLTAYVMSSLVNKLLSEIPLFGKTVFHWLFKSLGPWAADLGWPMWIAQWLGALQTVFFVIVVCLICIGLKRAKIFLKI